TTEWTFHESTIRFLPGVREIAIGRLYWNHPSGEVRDATQMISDITLIPIPKHTHSPEDINADRAAIANTVALRDSSAQINIPSVPGSNNHAASKYYVDREVATRAASSHTHSQSQITGLSTALNGKAAKSHTHAISDVTDLQAELDSKP